MTLPGEVRLHRYIESHGPLLQVALDTTSLATATRLGSLLSPISEKLILEAGTPLIKAVGAIAVNVLAALSSKPVIADTKTADAASVEVKLYAETGASAITVLGLSSPEVIEEALSSAAQYGIDIVVDTIHASDPLGLVDQLTGLGVKIVELHVGVDVQKRLGKTAAELVDLVRSIKQRYDVFVAVAGGLKPGRVKPLVEAGADIVIVGGAILRSSNPVATAQQLVREIES